MYKFESRQLVMIPRDITLEESDKLSYVSGLGIKAYTRGRDFKGNISLYVLSDEPIKEGDWFYYDNGDGAIKTKENYIDQLRKGDNVFDNCKKVIATTDRTLEVEHIEECKLTTNILYSKSLPNIPLNFIRYFVEQYNLGNIITEIFVNYECIPFSKEAPDRERDVRLVVIDNTIMAFSHKPIIHYKGGTIKEAIKNYCLEKYGEGYYPDVEKAIEFGVKWQQERSYSEEEVLELFKKYNDFEFGKDGWEEHLFIKWFEQFKKK